MIRPSTKDAYGSDKPSPIENPTLNRPAGATQIPARANDPVFLRSISGSSLEKEINAFLRSKEPELIRIMQRQWRSDKRSLSVAKIRAAYVQGDITGLDLRDFEQRYAELIAKKIAPAWSSAMVTSSAVTAKRIQSSLGASLVIPSLNMQHRRVRTWVATRSFELVNNLTSGQDAALKLMFNNLLTQEPKSPKDIARYVRSVIGVTPLQAQRAVNIRNAMLAAGESEEAVRLAVFNYTARANQVRAKRIARTELSFAFNQGTFEQMRQTQQSVLSDSTLVKQWATGEDERVCAHCGPLNGAIVGLEETFPGATRQVPNTFVPPAHPGCRCTIIYNIVESPS